MPAEPDGAPLRRRDVGAVVALFVAAQVVSLLHPALGALHLEESPNPALGVLAGWMPADEAARYAYRRYCGGCLLEGGLARGLFAALPEQLWVWKLVPLAFASLLVGAASTWAGRVAGRRAAWATGLLFVLPGSAFAALSLIGWGNHLEAAALATAVIAGVQRRGGPTRDLALGALGGLSVWVSWSGLPLVAAAFGGRWMVGEGGRALRLAAGLPLGLLGWAWQAWALGTSPLLVLRGDDVPDVGGTAGSKLADLADAEAIEQLLGVAEAGVGAWPGLVVLAAWAVATAAILTRGPRGASVVVLAQAAWLGAYLLSPFRLDPGDHLPAALPEKVRYALPWLGLLPPVLAVGAASLRPPRAGVALVLAVAAVGLLGRQATWHGPLTTDHLVGPAAHGPFVRHNPMQVVGQRPWRWTCPPDAARCEPLRAFALGVVAVHGARFRERPEPLAALRPPGEVDVDAWASGLAVASARLPRPDGPAPEVLTALAASWPVLDGVDRGGLLREAAVGGGLAAGLDVDALAAAPVGPESEALAYAAGVEAGRRWRPRWRPPEIPEGLAVAWAEGFGEAVGLRYGAAGARLVPPEAARPLAIAARTAMGRVQDGAWTSPWRP